MQTGCWWCMAIPQACCQVNANTGHPSSKAFLLGEDCDSHKVSDLEHMLMALHHKLKVLALKDQCRVPGAGTCQENCRDELQSC